MSRESVTLRGQAAAENGMQDACDIKRRTGETTSGGVVTPTWSTLYTGQKCRVQTRLESSAPTDVGQASVMLQRREVHLPMAVVGLRPDDRITITGSLDPELVGTVFVIRDVLAKTYATARRVTVIEVTS